jgi:PAS domain S-box-containing protein
MRCKTVIMRILQTFINTCFLLALAAGTVGAEEARKKIIAAVPADFPPTYFQDKNTGKAAGFAIDIMDEVAKRAGLEVDYVFGHPWDDIHQMVLSGKADVIPNLTISDDRKKLFIFTSSVESLPINYLVRSQDKKSATLKPGMKVGAMKGSIAQSHLSTHSDITLLLYDNLHNMLFDLLAGQLDMILTATPNIMKLAMDIGIEERLTVLEPPVMDGKRGVALRSGDQELYNRLEGVIREFVGSEKYIELYEKWWGKPKLYWTVQRVFTISAGVLVAIVALLGWLFWGATSRLNRKLTESLKETEGERAKLDVAVGDLQRSEERFRELFQNIVDPVYISDSKGKILAANEQAYLTLGYSQAELLACSLNELDAVTDSPEKVSEQLAGFPQERSATFESVHRRKDGSVFPVEVHVGIITFDGQPAIMGVARDISERKRAEEERLKLEQQILHAQKLESLGVLAGGIAHDFNNILMAIIGNAELALMKINKESPATDNLHRIEQAAARAADLAKQMLAYSGKGKFVIESINLNILLEEMLHMLEVSISKKAVLRLNLHQHLPAVEGDITQIRQIVMNLVINASEAIGDKSGVIAISTGCMDCDRSYLKNVWLDENLSDGLYVYLEIADSGCGMDRETMTKLFDPFFTTKFTGRGLGMAAVLGIVRGHLGAIKVYSEANRGTTFKILLPASGRPAEIFNGSTHTNEWQGNGTVLLVDDEETVRGIGTEMLKELGFTTITANDGRNAVELFKATPDIAFVILDLTMPHMDGEQCFRELRQLKPDVKVIMSSGYNEQEVTQKFVGKGLAGFIQKPYRLSTLQEVIRKITG